MTTGSQHQSPSPRYSCTICELGACDPDLCFYEPKDLLVTLDGTRLCHPCAKKHFRDISHLPKFAPTEHPDATAVDRFAAVMKAKLALKRAEGRGGWEDKQQCTPETLSAMLIACVRKGDPIDVANLAMMLHQRGERITLNDASEFESADFYWRTEDPDDSGEHPEDPINWAGLGPYCVAEIASSFTGPRRFGFTAHVLDPESDEEEFLHFATQTEAVEAAKIRRELIEAREEPAVKQEQSR